MLPKLPTRTGPKPPYVHPLGRLDVLYLLINSFIEFVFVNQILWLLWHSPLASFATTNSRLPPVIAATVNVRLAPGAACRLGALAAQWSRRALVAARRRRHAVRADAPLDALGARVQVRHTLAAAPGMRGAALHRPRQVRA